MKRLLVLLGAGLLLTAPSYAVQLRVENTAGTTTTQQLPGNFSVALSIVAVTEAGDGLDGVGWLGGSGMDVTHSVIGAAVADIDPTDIIIGAAFDDTGTNFAGSDTVIGVRNLVFAISVNNTNPPGQTVGDRVVIANVVVRVTGAQVGDTINISIADSVPPQEALANAAPLPQPVLVTSRTGHVIMVGEPPPGVTIVSPINPDSALPRALRGPNPCGIPPTLHGDAEELLGDEVFTAPGPRGKKVKCCFCFIGEFAAFENEAGLVALDELDLSLLGTPSFAAHALSRPSRQVIFRGRDFNADDFTGDEPGARAVRELDGGRAYVFYLVTDETVGIGPTVSADAFLAGPAIQTTSGPYFSITAANLDHDPRFGASMRYN